MPVSGYRAKAAALLLAATLTGPAAAHEFWIEPEAYDVAVGGEIEAQLKNGQFFKGVTYPYVPSYFSRFELVSRSGARPVAGRMGDNPALRVRAEEGGLHVAVYASNVNTVTYTDFAKFVAFVEEKGLGWVIDRHREEGLSEEKVLETYYRYAKALVKVGSGAGRDVAVGMPIELVAEINPYTAAAKDGVRVRLLFEGEGLPDWDVQVFRFPPGATEAVKTHVTTDKTGRALIPAYEGGEFLVNAVQIVKPRAADAGRNAQWESIWASLTYELPTAAADGG